MLAFVICIGVICAGLGFAMAVALVGPTAFENGRKHRIREERLERSDRLHAGVRVLR